MPNQPSCYLKVRAPRVRDSITLPPRCDEAELISYMLAVLRGRGYRADLTPDEVLIVSSRSDGRGPILNFVTDGIVWHSPDRTLYYAFSLRGGLTLCLALSAIAAGLGRFAFDSSSLAIFGLLAPILWLYGANHLVASVRVLAHLRRLCKATPTRRVKQRRASYIPPRSNISLPNLRTQHSVDAALL